MNKKDKKIIKQFDVLTKISPDCIKLFDIEGNLLYINPAGLKEHYLKNLKEAVDNGWRQTNTVIEEDKIKFTRALKDAIEKDKISTIEIRHTKQGSNKNVCLETIAPVKDDEGKLIGIFGVSRDISELKESEEKLKQKIEELEKLNNTMTGRELKMIELKEQIKKYKQNEKK